MRDLAQELRTYVDRLAELAEAGAEAAAVVPAAGEREPAEDPPEDAPDDLPGGTAARRRPRPGPRRRRVGFVVAGGAVAAALLAVVAIVAVVAGPDDDRPATTATSAAVEVEGPSGSRWFVLDVPGLTPELGFRESGTSSPVVTLQSFRTSAGLSGPMVWVASDPLIDDALGLEETEPGVVPTTVGGTPAFLRARGDSVRVSWPRSGAGITLVTAIGLPVEDVLALAEGLRPRGDADGGGSGVDATVLPRGLAEVTPEGPRSYRSEDAYWSYRRDGRYYSLLVETGPAARFEVFLWEAANSGGSGVETLSVDGRPGLISYNPDTRSGIAVWRPTETEVAQLITNGSRDDLVAALEALRPVDETTWQRQFPGS